MKKKIILNVIIIISMLILSAYTTTAIAADVSVTGITLNKTTVNLEVGQTEKLVATIAPENATNKNLNWSSSNSYIATVNANGEVKGMSKGVVTITATTIDKGFKAQATINVSGTSTLTMDKYSIVTDKNIVGADVKYIIKITPGTLLSKLKSNITTYNTMKVYDLSDKELTDNDALIITGMTLKVGESEQYVLVVNTDVNSDGMFTVADISRLKANMVGLVTLKDAEIKAADVNYDGKLTVLDLSMLKQMITGLIAI